MEGTTPDSVHRKESMKGLFPRTHVKIPEVLQTNGHGIQEEVG